MECSRSAACPQGSPEDAHVQNAGSEATESCASQALIAPPAAEHGDLAKCLARLQQWPVLPLPGACDAPGAERGSQGVMRAYLALLELVVALCLMAQHSPLAGLLLLVLGRLSARAQEGAPGHGDGLPRAASSEAAPPPLALEPPQEATAAVKVSHADVDSRPQEPGSIRGASAAADAVPAMAGSAAGGKRPAQGRRIRRRLVVMRRKAGAGSEGGHCPSSSAGNPTRRNGQGSRGEPSSSVAPAIVPTHAHNTPCNNIQHGSNSNSKGSGTSSGSAQGLRQAKAAFEEHPLTTGVWRQEESELHGAGRGAEGAEDSQSAAARRGSFESDPGHLRTVQWVHQTAPKWALPEGGADAAAVYQGEPEDWREAAEDEGFAFPACAAELSPVQGREPDPGSSDCSSVSGETQSSGAWPASLAPVRMGEPCLPDPYHDPTHTPCLSPSLSLHRDSGSAPEATGVPPADGDRCPVTWAEVVRQVVIRETERAAGSTPGADSGVPGAACVTQELILEAGDRGTHGAGETSVGKEVDDRWAVGVGNLERGCAEGGAVRGAQACLEELIAATAAAAAAGEGEKKEEAERENGPPSTASGEVPSAVFACVSTGPMSTSPKAPQEEASSPPAPLAASRPANSSFGEAPTSPRRVPGSGSFSESPMSEASFSTWTEMPDAALLEGAPFCLPLPTAGPPLGGAEPAPQAEPCPGSPRAIEGTGPGTGGEGASAPGEECNGSIGAAIGLIPSGSVSSPRTDLEALGDAADSGGASMGSSDLPSSTCPGSDVLNTAEDLGAGDLGLACASFGAEVVPQSTSLEGAAVFLSGTDSLGGTDSVMHMGSNTGSDSSGSHLSCGPPEAGPGDTPRGHQPGAEGPGSPPQASLKEGQGGRPEGGGAAGLTGKDLGSWASLSRVPKLARSHSGAEAEEAHKAVRTGGRRLGAFWGAGGLFSGSFLSKGSTDRQAVRSRGKKGDSPAIPLHIPRKGVLACLAPHSPGALGLGPLEEAARAGMRGAELPWVDYRDILHEQHQDASAPPENPSGNSSQQCSGLRFSRGRGLLQRGRGAKEGRGKALRMLGACGPGAFGASGKAGFFRTEGEEEGSGLSLAALAVVGDEEYEDELGFAAGFYGGSLWGPLEAVLEEDTLSSEQM